MLVNGLESVTSFSALLGTLYICGGKLNVAAGEDVTLSLYPRSEEDL